MKKLIDNNDYAGIEQALSDNPGLANEGIPYDDVNTTKAHPLHRICDGVFSGKYTDDEGVKIAKIFLEHGADINGNKLTEKKDTPLIAASSLHADQVAIFYIDKGANIHHAGTHGGTALHWAAWCGRDKVVRRLIQEGAEINKRCIDFKATPLFWAVHGLKNGGTNSIGDSLECVKILIQAGAEKNIPNADEKTVFDLLTVEDLELKELFALSSEQY
ncbi:MAG TPA: ankyrin repeat domain-containing protein [Flavitalea sp.]|nr:ankyrin repeat domain-containing protein [Flavitalea sp.]